ncbi:MAG: hypothetical protein IT376_23015 [Polyangiaceae bacterium]|nr:hypothetical protein [Polyangiaceae bacterium]
MTHAGRWLATLIAVGAGATLAPACGAGAPAPRPPAAFGARSPERCAEDEIREYYCDELLPLASSLAAPEPYGSCPATVEPRAGRVEPLPAMAGFDSDYTAYMRRRTPPGHTCCYSWCSPLAVREPRDPPDDLGCRHPLAIRESFCFDELEGGASSPADGAYPGCPAALEPPRGVAFSAPPVVPFSPNATAGRRRYGFRECCYEWCSVGAPVPIAPKDDRSR